MNPILINPIYFDAIQSVAKQNSIPKIYDSSNQTVNSISKQTNTKNALITGKPEEEADFITYNLRFQQNVPVSKSLVTVAPYNDINNLGYYIVTNSTQSTPIQTLTKQATDSIKRQINKLYNLGNTYDSGAILNVLY